jgi:hypothetical protein
LIPPQIAFLPSSVDGPLAIEQESGGVVNPALPFIHAAQAGKLINMSSALGSV